MNQESEGMYRQFRRTIERSAWILFVIVIAIESVIGYIWITKEWLIDGMTPLQYCLNYILLPTLINFTAIISYHYAEYRTNLPTSTKNYFLLLTFTVMCMSLSMTHNAVRMVPLSFVLPVFLSAIFGDYKTTQKCFVIDFFLYFCCSCFIFILSGGDRRFLLLDQLSGSVIMIASYLITRSIIRYEQKTKSQLIQYNLKQAHLIEQLKLDALTELYNHNTFYSILENAMKLANEQHISLILVILDIDDFKCINDTFGHSNGDIVLRELSLLLRKYTNDNVFAARYGGEEFCLLFQGYSQKEAKDISEEIRCGFENLSLAAIEHHKVTFSAGMVEYSAKYTSPTALFDCADEALYQAKADGKNKICIYSEKSLG